MSNQSISDNQNVSNTSQQQAPQLTQSKPAGTKSPYSSYYGSFDSNTQGNYYGGSFNQGYAQQPYGQDYSMYQQQQPNYNYGQPMNYQPPPQGYTQPQYNQPNPHQYNQTNSQTPPQNTSSPVTTSNPQVQQQVTPTPATPVTQTPQPFSFFPTIEGVHKSQMVTATYPQTSPYQQHPPMPMQQPGNMYNPSIHNIQNQVMNPLKEIYVLKNRYRSLAYRNADVLPVDVRSPYKTLQFFKSATIISIFFYSAFRTSYLMQSGMDKKVIMMRCLNFFLMYIMASTGFTILETRQVERAFESNFGNMSIPQIDAELKKLSELNPVLKY